LLEIKKLISSQMPNINITYSVYKLINLEKNKESVIFCMYIHKNQEKIPPTHFRLDIINYRNMKSIRLENSVVFV
jgi:hypothetical protein